VSAALSRESLHKLCMCALHPQGSLSPLFTACYQFAILSESLLLVLGLLLSRYENKMNSRTSMDSHQASPFEKFRSEPLEVNDAVRKHIPDCTNYVRSLNLCLEELVFYAQATRNVCPFPPLSRESMSIFCGFGSA